MKPLPFSAKQMKALCWWCEKSPFKDQNAVICDGAVRSGKTICMGISFVMWAFYRFDESSFALCGKTIRSIKRNMVTEMIPVLKELGFACDVKYSENRMDISSAGRKNRFYLFGGKDEASASLIQGMTLSGILLDEVALMPRSFVEQALARCSAEGAKFWFNCNPESPDHWFYREWIRKAEERKALYIHFTMRDNPSLSNETVERYEKMFSGTFYQRFIEGKWVKAEGLVYPFMGEAMYCDVPAHGVEEWALSVDYGTVNPTSAGLWGRVGETWYRTEEYYYSSRLSGAQRTDEEHYGEIKKLCGNKKISAMAVDPSAASLIALIKKRGEFPVVPAENNVVNGIRLTGSALKTGRIKICRNCSAAIKEFGLYSWNDHVAKDTPLKENDHAMDDIRYFVSTLLESGGMFVCAVARYEKGSV